MRALLLVVSLVACKTDRERPPVNPGGPGNPSMPGEGVDAPDDLGDGGGIIGRVCLVRDLRQPFTGCADSGADGLVVTLGNRTTTTDVNGGFVIGAPLGSNLTWRVSGAGIASSVRSFGTDHVIPVVDIDDYSEQLLQNGVVLVSGQGSIVARVVRAGVLVRDATATTQPLAQSAPRYDGSLVTVWETDATGSFGAVWIPDAPVGNATLSIVPPGGGAQMEPVLVEDLAITFVTIEIP